MVSPTLENKLIERIERVTCSEHKYRRIFEQSPDAIILADKDFKVIEINRAGIELTGISKDEILLKNMDIGSFCADPYDWEKLLLKVKSDEYILNEEISFKRADNASIMVIITGGVDYGSFDHAKSYHFIIKNINEKKIMGQQIAQAEKLAVMSELLAGVAHAINNPLSIILGYTQLLLRQDNGADSSSNQDLEDLKTIEKHAQNCKSVVSDLLAFSRKGTSRVEKLDINSLIESISQFISYHSDFKNIEVSFELDSDTPIEITGNEQELSRMLVDILINACHACDKKGIIKVNTKKQDQKTVLIMVEDNGKGIKSTDLLRIFDPFFTTKPVGQGTGLGLSVGYGIIKRHHGDIRVKSLPGKGSTFTITLPLTGSTNNFSI